LNTVGAIVTRPTTKSGQSCQLHHQSLLNYSTTAFELPVLFLRPKKAGRDGFQHSVEEIVQKAREALHLGITELHIVGGLHPSLPFSYYTDMLNALRALDPKFS